MKRQHQLIHKLAALFVLLVVVVAGSGFFVPFILDAFAVSPPNIISYQGRILNSNGAPVSDATLSMEFRLYTAASGGTCLWSNSSANCDSDTPASTVARTVTLTDGLFSENLGDTTLASPYAAIADTVFADNASLYLEVEIAGEVLTPRKQLVASGFALNADSLDGLDSTDLLASAGDTATGEYDFSGAEFLGASPFVFEGATNDGTNLTTFAFTDPTAPRTITFKDESGTVAYLSDISSPTTTLDDAYNNYGATASIINVDAAQGQTGGLEFSIDGADDFTIDLQSTGDFVIQDAGTDIFTFADHETITYTNAFSSTSNAITLNGFALTSGTLINATANLLTSGGFFSANTTAAFTGDLVTFNATGAATGNFFSISSSSATATAQVLDINLDNGDNDNDVITLVTDETTNSGTAADTTKFRLTASGEVFSDVGFTAGGASTNYYDGSITSSSAFTYASPTSFTWQDDASNILMTLTDGGTTGTLNVTGDITCTDCLDFTDFSDTLNLDSTTFVTGGAGESFIFSRTLTDATGETGVTISVTASDTTSGTIAQNGLVVSNQASTEGLDHLLYLQNVDTDDAVLVGLGFDSDTGGITTAIDASDADITTSLDIGSNFILADGIRLAELSTGVLTFEDTSGNDLMTLTDEGTSAVINVSDLDVFGGDLRVYSAAGYNGRIAAFVNGGDDDFNTGIVIQSCANTNPTATCDFIGFYDGDGTKLGAVEGDGAGGITNASAGSDYAELFPGTYASFGKGDVLALDVTGNISLATDARSVIGAFSVAPNTLGNWVDGWQSSGAYVPVALLGQVPVNADTSGGAISAGDYVTLSANAGVVTKQNGPGYALGMALESLPSGSGQIQVFISPGWHADDTIITSAGKNQFASDFLFGSTGTADVLTQQKASQALSFRGSAWDGAAAQNVDMTLSVDVNSLSDYQLSIANDSGTEVAFVNNSGDLALAGRLYPSDSGTIQTDKYIYYDSTGAPALDYMRTNAAGWGVGSYDFAEMFPSIDPVKAGELVVFADDKESVRRSTGETYDQGIAGIVSTRPGFLAGEFIKGHVPIALAGRVPTFVTAENGPIQPGDPLTTSSKPGYAMKATEAGPIVGYAMEAFNGTEGSIIVYVNVSYYDGGDTTDAPAASNVISGVQNVSNLNVSGNLSLGGGQIISVASIGGIGDAWTIAEDGTIRTNGRVISVVRSYANENVDTYAVTSRETTIQLSGSVQMTNGQATVAFSDVDDKFQNIISTTAPYRVLITANGATNALYVAERTNQGFTIHETDGHSSVMVDWLVIAYHKDYEPAETTVDPVMEPAVTTEETTDPVVDQTADTTVDVQETPTQTNTDTTVTDTSQDPVTDPVVDTNIPDSTTEVTDPSLIETQL